MFYRHTITPVWAGKVYLTYFPGKGYWALADIFFKDKIYDDSLTMVFVRKAYRYRC